MQCWSPSFAVEFTKNLMTEAPVLTFQSIYHEGENGQPYEKVYHDVPYSPRWSANEVTERIKSVHALFYSISKLSTIQLLKHDQS